MIMRTFQLSLQSFSISRTLKTHLPINMLMWVRVNKDLLLLLTSYVNIYWRNQETINVYKLTMVFGKKIKTKQTKRKQYLTFFSISEIETELKLPKQNLPWNISRTACPCRFPRPRRSAPGRKLGSALGRIKQIGLFCCCHLNALAGLEKRLLNQTWWRAGGFSLLIIQIFHKPALLLLHFAQHRL